MSSAAGGACGKSYQRLEFLGDRVLGLAIAEMLYRRLPRRAGRRAVAPPGRARAPRDLRRGRRAPGTSAPISGSAPARRSAAAAQPHDPGRRLRGVIGAVFLDGGYEAAQAVVERAFGRAAERARASAVRDPKSALQEWAQGRGLPTPTYDDGRADRPRPRAALPHRRSRSRASRPAAGTGRRSASPNRTRRESLLLREGVLEADRTTSWQARACDAADEPSLKRPRRAAASSP